MSSVAIIEPDGMWKGWNRKLRTTRTTTMTGSQNRSAAATVPCSGFGSAPAFIDVGHAAPSGHVPLPKFVRPFATL